MLKGIVSSEEKDIVRIPMNGQNLFDKNTAVIGERVLPNSVLADANMAHSDYIDVTGIRTLTVNKKHSSTNFYFYANKTNTSIGYVNDFTANVPLGAKYCRINVPKDDVDTIMLNSGSTALPYEPYGYQEGWEVRDSQDRLIWGKNNTIQGAPPVSFRGFGVPLKSLTVLGNGIQTGTPTSDNPIMPEFVGVRTGNLFDLNATDTANGYVNGAYLLSDGLESANPIYRISEYIEIQDSTAYTLVYGSSLNNPSLCFYDSLKQYISGQKYDGNRTVTVTSPSDAKYIRISHIYTARESVMLNAGTTALPYEPYGWKVPVTVGSTTTPLHLGTNQTLRRIRKLVLDGTEEWAYIADGKHWTPVTGYLKSGLMCACSHYEAVPNVSGSGGIRNGKVSFYSSSSRLIFCDAKHTTTEDWKSYLADQYVAGTPVTVWYILATPETGIVNEPLAKIGDYADELTVDSDTIQVTTTSGTNVLTIDTTVQPSNVSITGHIKPIS